MDRMADEAARTALATPARHVALLIVDLQNDNSHPDGLRARHGQDVATIHTRVIPRVLGLLTVARTSGVLVAFLRNTQRPDRLGGSLERSARWRAWAGDDADRYSLQGTWGHAIVDALTPLDDELVIDKDRPSAFHATPLDLVLRARGVRTVAVTGAVTEACIEATAFHAGWLDYLPVVVEDCVGSHSAATHEAAMTLMRRRHAVVDSATLAASWR